jgi:hypothetical protein
VPDGWPARLEPPIWKIARSFALYAAMLIQATAAERKVLETLTSGEVADFSERPPDERRLRAEFLRAVLSDSDDDLDARGGVERWPRFRGRMRIRGARISGVLRAPIGDGSLALARGTLSFDDCTFDDAVDLSGAEFLSVRLLGCTLPAFIGASLRLKSDLDLSGSRLSGIADHRSDLGDIGACSVYLNAARVGGRLQLGVHDGRRFDAAGTVRIEGATIEGDLILDGASLDGRGEQALDARATSVGGDVSMVPALGRSFEARGEVSLSAATIAGDLSLVAALLLNPQGRALHCEDLKVESVLLASTGDVPFRAAGRINFLSAVVGGNFSFTNARVLPGPDYQGRIARGGPVCINLQQLRVSNALLISNVGQLDLALLDERASSPPRPVAGWFLLTAAQLHSLLDGDDGWPAPGFLEIEALSYDRISDAGGGDQVARRMRWLRLQYPNGTPTAATFRPQPFEELSRVLRQHGRTDEAAAIAVEKIRMRLAAKVDDRWSRLVPALLMLVSRHGHSSARALGSFLAFLALGGVLYGTALWGFDQPFVPVERDPVSVEYTAGFGLLRTFHTEGCPALVVPYFALDAALPLIDIGQSSTCRFDPRGPTRWIWLLLHSVYTLLGAALSAVVVLTLSGLLRRD